MRGKAALLTGICVGAMMIPVQAQAQDTYDPPNTPPDFNTPEIIVTAQRQAQSLQAVPIAVSAFDAQALEAQQIENAADLQLTLPNVSFTKSNFTSSSFTIRGIGDLCVGVTCDSATAIHVNSAPLFGTRLFETEYFDLDRIEVLRGPQGTLFGRSATSGVVNIVTAKPILGEFRGSGEFEYGNYDSIKATGMLNVPIGSTMAARVAGFYLNRDGFTENLFNDTRIDGRDMYAVRGSLRWEPTSTTTVDLIGYYFREDDDRLRVQKQQCQRDPTGVLGCLNNNLAFEKVNLNATFTGTLGSDEFLAINGLPPGFGLNSLYGPDAFSNFQEPEDFRKVSTSFTPEYFADELQVQLQVDQDFGAFNVSLSGIYQEASVDSRQDYNLGILDRSGFAPALNQTAFFAANGVPTGLPAGLPQFVPGSSAYFAPIANALFPNGPNGVLCTSEASLDNRGAFEGERVCDTLPVSFDRSNEDRRSYSGEIIVSSDFDGPFNFLLGGIYANSQVSENSYFINTFAIDYIGGLLGSFNTFGTVLDADPTNDLPPSYLGPSMFRNNTLGFELDSYGIFGEVYFDVNDRLQLTAGLRYNNDEKANVARSTLVSFLVPYALQDNPFNSPFVAPTFDADPGTPGNQLVQAREVSFDAITGRFVADYELTPDNLLYASYSRGYKSGGINPPLQPIFAVPEGFEKESIDAFEIGSKNTFANGQLVLNATAFYYKYKDLQLSRIIARTSVNDTIDANIYGVEVEAVIRPDPALLVNMSFSYLKSEVAGDEFFSNPRDPAGGRSDAVIIKDITNGANCAVVPTAAGNGAGANAFVGAINAGLGLRAPTAFPANGNINATGAFSICSALQQQAAAVGAAFGGIQVLSPGVEVNLKGNDLPQAPSFKASVGAQYTVFFDNGMTLVPRADLAFTGEQFGSIFNGNVNSIDSFVQANARVQLNGPDDSYFVRAFVQNIFDSSSVTGLYLTDAASGLFTNVFTLDPRRYGVAVGVQF